MKLSANYTAFKRMRPSTNYTLLITHALLYQLHGVHTCMHLSANYTVFLKQKTVILCIPSFPFISVWHKLQTSADTIRNNGDGRTSNRITVQNRRATTKRLRFKDRHQPNCNGHDGNRTQGRRNRQCADPSAELLPPSLAWLQPNADGLFE
jgi:hypothetical protein